ncbi:MAG: hypothetical protein WC383_07770 [Gammaproteobacteria bacterium]
MASNRSQETKKAFAYGFASAGLYLLLFVYAKAIMQYSAQGGWYFVIPVAVAFVFSYVHGNFTSYFWDALGIKAKSSGGAK